MNTSSNIATAEACTLVQVEGQTSPVTRPVHPAIVTTCPVIDPQTVTASRSLNVA